MKEFYKIDKFLDLVNWKGCGDTNCSRSTWNDQDLEKELEKYGISVTIENYIVEIS